jgi:protein-tyrosine-phosphatase
MAAAIFNKLANPTKVCAISAGTQPGEHVQPEVVEVMREWGLDLKSAAQRKLTDDPAAAEADILLTWAAARRAPSFQASSARTGRSTIRRESPSIQCDRSGPRLGSDPERSLRSRGR